MRLIIPRNDARLLQHDLNNFCAAVKMKLVQLLGKPVQNQNGLRNKRLIELEWQVEDYWDDGAVAGYCAAWITATNERRARFPGDSVKKGKRPKCVKESQPSAT